MRYRPTHTVLALAAAIAAIPAASAVAAPIDVPVAGEGRIEARADISNYTDLSSLLTRKPYLAADGRWLWLYNAQRSIDDAGPLGVVSVRPVAGGPSGEVGYWTVPLIFDGTIVGSSALRELRGSTRTGNFGDMAAVDGGSWVGDAPLTPRPARNQLLRFDDLGQATGKIRVPRGIVLDLAVETSRGIRLIGHERRPGLRPSRAHMMISGPGGRRWVRDPYLAAPNQYDPLLAAAPLPDGSILLTGASRAAGLTAMPVLRIRPNGRIARLADRRRPDAAAYTGLTGMTPTSAGIVMAESSLGRVPYYGEPDLRGGVVLRGNDGRVTIRKTASEVASSSGAIVCENPTARAIVTSVGTGADGLPTVRLVCAVSSGGTSPWLVQRITAGLAADLTVRWSREDGFGEQQCYPASSYDLTGSDGRQWTVSCDGGFLANAIPGALPVLPGKLVSAKRDATRGAVLRIRCKAPYGSVCTGKATVTVAGKPVGSASYTLPGRPGGAAAEIVRHVPTASKLPKRFSAVLAAQS